MNLSVAKSYKFDEAKKPERIYREYNKGLQITRPDTQAKYKTELCRNLENGFCEFGDKCFFAHCIEELRGKSWNIVSQGGSGATMTKCKKFFEMGYCLNGNKCIFSHKELIPETAANSPEQSCKTSRKGSEDLFMNFVFVDLETRSFF